MHDSTSSWVRRRRVLLPESRRRAWPIPRIPVRYPSTVLPGRNSSYGTARCLAMAGSNQLYRSCKGGGGTEVNHADAAGFVLHRVSCFVRQYLSPQRCEGLGFRVQSLRFGVEG